MKTNLKTILNTGSYKYCYENSKFTFYDNRISDITMEKYNSSLYSAIRQERIIILDLSMCPNVPKVINGFPYVTEIIMPTLTDNIPSIANCPKLEKVTFDSSTIKILKEKSFDGWPPIKQIAFGEDFGYTLSFCISPNAQIDSLDFSQCKHMHLTEHAFQRSRIKSISLPDHITNLPEYVFFDCPNLASILAIGVIKINFNALRNCNSLEHLKFAEEFHTDNIDRYFYDEDYDTSRCGIEIGKDDIYSYIWCLTNFKFYYTERLSDEWSNRIFSFNHMNRRSFLMFFGDIDIYSNYKDHYASNISEGFLKTSSRYTKITHNGRYVGSEDLQKNAIKYYYEIDKRLKTDIRDVIKQIEEEVDKLDINSIIDSYETTISEWTKTKIGDDDTFYSETHRCSYYSDAYLETILPSYHSEYKDSGYTTNWPWTSKKEIDEMHLEDSRIREMARKSYSKEAHITYLIKEYIQYIANKSAEVEHYLHIGRAKEVFEQYAYLHGKERVSELNRVIII